MATSRGSNDKKEGAIEVAAYTVVCVAVMVGLLWIGANDKIVRFWVPILYGAAKLWAVLPAEILADRLDVLKASGNALLFARKDAGFFDFAAFANEALRPLMFVVTVAATAWLGIVLAAPQADVFRRFKDADSLLRRMSTIFSGTVPIIHIRKEIAQHKDPLWARQLFPEELITTGRVNGKPLIVDGELDGRRAEEWFKALTPAAGSGASASGRGRLSGGKAGQLSRKAPHSRMLGSLIVDLTQDRIHFVAKVAGNAGAAATGAAGAGNDFSFADRFSDTGKAIFGLLCAHAFGGSEGISDFRRARDQLNNSCRGAPHGIPNLTVAQWIFDKYRCNDLAHKLFAVHHWEYTYLYELFVQAKRRGKCTHAEFLWLKPTDRILFYVLNTVGRWTPHTESAAAFNHHAYERKCARLKRLPLGVPEGRDEFQHVMFVKGAVTGLMADWRRMKEAVDENDDEWWKDAAGWVQSNAAVNKVMRQPVAPSGAAADEVLASSGFDNAQVKARAAADAETKQREDDALASLLG